MKQSIILKSTLSLVFFCIYSLYSIDTIRTTVMTGIVDKQEIHESFNKIIQTLQKNIPNDALQQPLKVGYTHSTNQPSSLSVHAHFKNGISYRHYIKKIERTLKHLSPTEYHLVEGRPTPSCLQAVMLGRDDYAFRKLPIPSSIKTKQKNIQPYYHPYILPSIAERISLNISFKPRPTRQQIHPLNKKFLHRMPPSYFAEQFGNPEYAFHKYEGYQFQGFRSYVESSNKFKDFILNFTPQVNAESLNSQVNFDIYSYLYDRYEEFYRERQREKARQNPNFLKLKQYHKTLYDGQTLLQGDNPNIEDIDKLLDSLTNLLDNNSSHRDLYECALFAANTAHIAKTNNNQAQYKRSLARLDKLLHSLESETITEHKKYALDKNLLKLNDYESSETLSICSGLPIQTHLHDEYVTINHDIAILNGLRSLQPHIQSYHEGMTGLLNHYAQLARFTNEDLKIQESFALHDTCWNILEFARQNTILEMHLSDPNFNSNCLSNNSIAAQHPASTFIPIKQKLLSALEVIRDGATKGVQQFCSDTIDDIKLLCSNPIAFGKRYTDSLVMLGKGVYNAGYFICLSEDQQHEAIMDSYRSIKKYLEKTTLEENVKNSIAFLTQTGLSIASGRLITPLKTKMLNNIKSIANAIDLEKKAQKPWSRIKRILAPSKNPPINVPPATAYAILQRSEKEIQYHHITSGLLKHERKKSSKTINHAQKKMRQKNFMSNVEHQIEEIKKKHNDIFSKSAIEHIQTGEFLIQKGSPIKLSSGCHTYEGFLYAAKKSKIDVKNIVFEYNNKKVIRVRMPRELLSGRAIRGSGVTLLNNDKIGVKTLFPKDMSFDEIVDIGKKLISNPKKYKVDKNRYEGIVNGILIVAYTNTNNKITTLFPRF